MGFMPAEREITTTESRRAEESRKRERQRLALIDLQRLVDWDAINNDQAWHSAAPSRDDG